MPLLVPRQPPFGGGYPHAIPFDPDRPTSVENMPRRLILRYQNTRRNSIYLGRRDRLEQLDRELNQLTRLQINWDSYGADAPTVESIQRAGRALRTLRDHDFEPNAIVPSAEGGVAIVFIQQDKYAHLELLNSGAVTIMTLRRGEDPSVIELTDSDQDLERGLSAIDAYYNQ